ncbi:glycosyltransferase family 87 protein [Mycobacterium asiaticum]|uniref:DUF2029 domain-containing protein n=1 Tax=Mycobacterium asiaticum TaxID=1790 RepID=A0A1A3CSK2_MYCAS|nr:glycosyltransferase family 87 protein [Mycobacterium asiaticum]OBI89840.1 hypothetical protein A9X01_13460 [Mycobacterium asiaticum]
MKHPLETLRDATSGIRQRLSGIANQSERTILLSTVLLVTSLSAAAGFVLTQYFSVDVISSLLYFPEDCWRDWGAKIGRHCFSDYIWQADAALRADPWKPYPVFLPPDYRPYNNPYSAAATVPHAAFGLLGKLLGSARLGLLAYLLALTVAVLSPAVWAARGARGLERVVVFVTCGVAAIPAWTVIDRGNSLGFLVPIALVFLIALQRRRWGLVALMIVLASLVKPQFAVLVFALFAARQWRWGGIAAIGGVVTNVAAYLLWPQDFPGTVLQSVHNALGSGSFQALVLHVNVSFGRGLLLIPDAIKANASGGVVPEGYLAGLRSQIGYVVLLVIVISVLALGRRISPAMVGIVLLSAASLFPALSHRYYLVFVLPVAALIVRDPDGPPGCGIFERLSVLGDRRRAVGICVSIAAALTLAQTVAPGPIVQAPIAGQMGVIGNVDTRAIIPVTTGALAPLLWLLACAAIIVSYARRPALSMRSELQVTGTGAPGTAGESSPMTRDHIAELPSESPR